MFTLEELQAILNIVANAPISFAQAAPLVQKIHAEATAMTPPPAVAAQLEEANSGQVILG
jgi:hypothetical protein